jgi:hypothetical protein
MSRPRSITASPAGRELPAVAAAPRRPRERRVRIGHAALAVALMAVGGLGTAALVESVSATGAYLAVARDVGFGTELTEDDLTTVRVSTAPGLTPIAAGDLSRVVGLYAAMPLAAGTLLTPGHVTAERMPGPGQHILGITVRDDRLPARRPLPGEPVLLVATEGQGAAPAGQEGAPPATFEATVVEVADSGQGGILGAGGGTAVTLDVLVSAADGPEVASLAAANRVVIVLRSGG